MNGKETNINTIYEYDKYDIIDFLEPEYIDDWLSILPNDIWINNKKTIENHICKLKDKKIISFVIKKINANLPKIIVNNFDKINLELLKYCVETNFTQLINEIKKNQYTYKEIIKKCILNYDIEFNKYFYETIYFKLEPEHQIKPNPNLTNLYGILEEEVHKDNMFHNFIKNNNVSSYSWINDWEVLKYYNEKFKNIFTNKNRKLLCDTFITILVKNKIDNYNNFLNLKNMLTITNSELSKLLFGFDKIRYIIPNVCLLGDINYIFQILNLCDDNLLLKKENVVILMVYTSLSNKTENVFLVYNYLIFGKNYKFTPEIYSEIITTIIRLGDKKHFEYKNIIMEFINLGGIVKGYSMYTDYIERLNIKN